MRRLISLLAVALATTTLASAETITSFTYTFNTSSPGQTTPLTTTAAFSISSTQTPTLSPTLVTIGNTTVAITDQLAYSNVAVSIDGADSTPLNIFFDDLPTANAAAFSISLPNSIFGFSGSIPDRSLFNEYATNGNFFTPETVTFQLGYADSTGQVRTSSSPVLTITQTTAPDPTAVTPEPASLALLGTGLAGLGTILRRRSR